MPNIYVEPGTPQPQPKLPIAELTRQRAEVDLAIRRLELAKLRKDVVEAPVIRQVAETLIRQMVAVLRRLPTDVPPTLAGKYTQEGMTAALKYYCEEEIEALRTALENYPWPDREH